MIGIEGALHFLKDRFQATPFPFELANGRKDTVGQIVPNDRVIVMKVLFQLILDHLGRKSYESGEVAYAFDCKVFELKAVSCHTCSEGAVSVNGIELLAQLMAGLTKWVFRHSVPQPLMVFGCGLTGVELAVDDVHLVDIVRYQMVDGVPNLRWNS